MPIWAFDNNAQNTSPGAINNTQLSLILASSSAFAGLAAGAQAVLMIQDTGLGGVGPSKYEFVLATANNTGTNTITLSQRGYDGTTAQSFMAGALVTQVMSKQVLTTAYARVDNVGALMGMTPSAGLGPPQAGGPNPVGMLWIDSIGGLFICTVAGSPGTWKLLNAPLFQTLTWANSSTPQVSNTLPTVGYRNIRIVGRDLIWAGPGITDNVAFYFNGDQTSGHYQYSTIDQTNASGTPAGTVGNTFAGFPWGPLIGLAGGDGGGDYRIYDFLSTVDSSKQIQGYAKAGGTTTWQASWRTGVWVATAQAITSIGFKTANPTVFSGSIDIYLEP